ncbi:RNA-guided endonuclease InsQ/TnpB family protein [Ktedonobacter racemifer]|uniref:Transposase, IS605 OrfB family n=1 Tax=Ktedonobacter racemifer DSM 44963 TaxID=485913 RepID=D6TTJ9_KTERA|nr:RNA-guided endonuclease TnpB family protein [Ktedonobacter racemifer]EFH83750.1 transposase, IS605 OrfB family [Ktedonobacter racemifer DSM 44963]
MIKAHKIRLHPTEEQKGYFAKAAGTARFVWNWALAEWNRQYEAGERPTALKLKKQFNKIRREQYPWTWEVTKNASDQPFLDLAKAWIAYFEGLKNGTKTGRPTFKSKKKSRPGFYLANDQFELGDYRIWIPKLGWVNMAEKLRFTGKVTGARLTRQADWWFVSVTVEVPDEFPLRKGRPSVGVDVGLNRLATLSDGTEFENQRFLKTALKKLRQANKRLHRRKPGSKNREKARRKVARLHYKVACMREDVLQKLTTKAANTFALVGIEDLHIKGLMKNRKLSRSFSDAALGRLLRLLSMKVTHRGGVVVKVDRYFPSSQLCSRCGWRWKDIRLSDRVFVCKSCGLVADRDKNAALNLLQEAQRLVAAFPPCEVDHGTGSDGS